MILGVISKHENYWSLRNFTNDFLEYARENYQVLEYQHNGGEIDIEAINLIYKKSDIIINTSSKCIDYKKDNSKTTLFFGHAWMDHGAGINLYRNSQFFGENDIVTFASSAALNKFRYVYGNSLPSVVLPYFSTINEASDTYQRLSDNHNKKQKIMLYHGRITVEKNLFGLIDLFEELSLENTNLIIVGSPSFLKTYGFGQTIENPNSYYEDLQKRISSIEGERITIRDYMDREEILNIISQSSLNINLSTNFEEDFGISAIESMMLGVPVFSTAWGGLKDINPLESLRAKTTLSKNGSVRIDYSQNIQFLKTLLSDTVQYKKLSSYVQEYAINNYSKNAFACNFEKLLTIIVHQGKKSNKQEPLLVPRIHIQKIYDQVLKKGKVDCIYIDYPELFYELYQYYASESPS